MRHTNSLTILLLLLAGSSLTAQAVVTANSSSGGAYDRIRAQDWQIESPDEFAQGECDGNNQGDHSSFGEHIDQVYDTQLERNVFRFFSHINRDSDMCRKFDRVRIEVKGMPGSGIDPEIQHTNGEQSWYRFQFKLPTTFKGSTNFSHLFQNKATGGDDSFPLITISAKTTTIEVRHDAGDNTSADEGRMVSAPISEFKGKWVEVYMRQKHSNNGEFYIKIINMSTGATILEHEDLNIDLWRQGAQINRPKFGIYRRITSEAQDEVVRFAGFCSSESSEGMCPSLATGSSNSSISGTYYFRNRATGNYLDADANGNVKAGSFSSNDDHKWRLVLSNGNQGDYNIDSQQSGRGVLEATGTSTVKYVTAEPVQTANRREWNVESLGNNIYRFNNRDKGRYLAQENGSTGIESTTWNGNRSQWILESVSSNLTSTSAKTSDHRPFTVTPNPVADVFTVSMEGRSPATLSMFDASGKLVLETVLTSNRQQIQRPAKLPSGVYYMRIRDQAGLTGSQRIILR